MHVTAITTPETQVEAELIGQMHRLRADVFGGRLSWNVHCIDGMERDAFDSLRPTYILAVAPGQRVVGSARLLPVSGPTMLELIFPRLLERGGLNSHDRMIESSRFCIDTGMAKERGPGALNLATFTMFAGIVEWCCLHGYTEIVTATDVRFERILRRAGWPLRRLGNVVDFGNLKGVAGVLSADRTRFECLRPEGYRSSFAASSKRAA